MNLSLNLPEAPRAVPIEYELVEDLAKFTHDPLGHIMYSYPWGEPGSELEKFPEGPEEWQKGILSDLRDGLLTFDEAIRLAVASGNGVGKSSLVAWIILWAMSTFEDTRCIITANTETQLTTKTWVELSKWYRIFIGRSLFRLTATALFSVDPEHERTWRADMIPWSERNPEAFAGMHNKGKRIVLIFDEASNIMDMIWETAEGAMTDSDTEIIWAVFGNGTRNSGRFYECWHRFSHRWLTRSVDSRTVRLSNKVQIEGWVNDYGADSDFVRVHVLGEFPRQGSLEFISAESVREAQTREIRPETFEPLVLGVDVARFGSDASVLYFRRGTDARTILPIKLRGVDTMNLAGRVAAEYARLQVDAVFVDGTGVGGGVVDRLRQLNIPCWDINFSSSADNIGPEKVRYANKRAEIWGLMRYWLQKGAIPNEKELETQLVGPEYAFNARNEIQLEAKKDMTRRGLPSPDIADALALTFSFPVQRKAFSFGGKPRHQIEYDPFADAWRS